MQLKYTNFKCKKKHRYFSTVYIFLLKNHLSLIKLKYQLFNRQPHYSVGRKDTSIALEVQS